MRINEGDIFSSSVRGNVRKQNEDSCGVFDVPNGKLFVVCDGMGGHAGGATASKIGVDSIANYFQQSKYPDARLALAEALEYANMQIIDAANEMPSLKGMGTTACVLLVQGDEAWIAHCGDSRIYLYCAEQQWLHRVTKDHSYVQGLVDQGIISDAEAEHHPNKNRILKALGIKPDCKPTVCEQPILPANGDTFLICSDGLSGMVEDEQLQYVLQQEGTILNKGQMMIQLALQAGGLDNITTQLIKISDSPHAHSAFVSQNPKERAVPAPAPKVPQQKKTEVEPVKKMKKKSPKRVYLIVTIVLALLLVAGGALWFILPGSSEKGSSKGNETIPINPEEIYNSLDVDIVLPDNSIPSVDSMWVITFQKIDPVLHKTVGNMEMKYGDKNSVHSDICCANIRYNYIFTQKEYDFDTKDYVVQQRNKHKMNVKFLYEKSINNEITNLTIEKPEKPQIPSKNCIIVKKYECDVFGKRIDGKRDELIEDIQWRYTYYENGVQKETSDYYANNEISRIAQDKLKNAAPDSVLCKVVWYNFDKSVENSADNKPKHEAYLTEKENERILNEVKAYATEITKCEGELIDFTRGQKAQIKKDADEIIKAVNAKEVQRAEQLKKDLEEKVNQFKAENEKQKQIAEALESLKAYATEITKCEGELIDFTRDQKAQIKKDADEIIRAVKAKEVQRAEQLKKDLEEKVNQFKAENSNKEKPEQQTEPVSETTDGVTDGVTDENNLK